MEPPEVKHMKIGIVGAGNIGGVLARNLTKLGHAVAVANSRGPESLAAVAAEWGARAATVLDAARTSELVVVTIPQKSVPLLAKGLFDGVPASVPVVDTGNYYPSLRDGPIDAIERGQTESGWVASVLGRPVVKAFNNIMTASLESGGLPKGVPGRIALPIAGDDARARAAVMALVDELGFDPVDAGGLDESWRQQPGTPVYCTDLDAAGVHKALARADRAHAPELREASIKKLLPLLPSLSPSEFIRETRKLFDRELPQRTRS
jgi:predicted dinucleotide-binding enzyme